MGFKKYIKSRRRGQSVLEYFLLLLAVVGLTLVSISALLPQLREKGEGFFNRAATRIGAKPETTGQTGSGSTTCGDGICSAGEQGSCPEDCPVCGDGICSMGESCLQDCGGSA